MAHTWKEGILYSIWVVVAVIATIDLISDEELDVASRLLNKRQELQDAGEKRHFGARLSLCGLYQAMGIGWWVPTSSGKSAHDLSLSCNFIFWVANDVGKVMAFPSFRYQYIAYKSQQTHPSVRKYNGYGLDLLIIDPRMAIPNFKISWGKKFNDDSFYQWSVNILPAALAAYYTIPIAIAAYEFKLNDMRDDGIIRGLAILGLSTAVEYSFGF